MCQWSEIRTVLRRATARHAGADHRLWLGGALPHPWALAWMKIDYFITCRSKGLFTAAKENILKLCRRFPPTVCLGVMGVRRSLSPGTDVERCMMGKNSCNSSTAIPWGAVYFHSGDEVKPFLQNSNHKLKLQRRTLHTISVSHMTCLHHYNYLKTVTMLHNKLCL